MKFSLFTAFCEKAVPKLTRLEYKTSTKNIYLYKNE